MNVEKEEQAGADGGRAGADKLPAESDAKQVRAGRERPRTGKVAVLAGKATVLAEPVWAVVLVCAVFAAAGAGAGWLIKLLAQWFVTLPWAPWQGPARLLTSIPEPWRTVGVLAVGAVLGLAAGYLAQHDRLSVTISGSRVVLTRKGISREFTHHEIDTALRDGKQLVLLGRDGQEIAREACDLDAQRLADAFAEHGYRWSDGDPHRDEFRLWVPRSPGLPEGADALLTARARLLGKPAAAEARELREELAELGVVVRDENKRQYWRTARTTRTARS
ncbi:YqeB family protein [Streptomyces lydicus]